MRGSLRSNIMSNVVKVPIFVESRYKVNRKKVTQKVKEVLESNGITSAVEISIAIVGDRKMKILNKKYKNLDKTTNVLSFSQTEGENPIVPNGSLLLGDIVLSYPQIIKEASEEAMFVDDKINELVAHGLTHLLGIHHE